MVQEDLLANDLVIDGEYMSEETMKNDWNFTQQPSSIKYYIHVTDSYIMMKWLMTKFHCCI